MFSNFKRLNDILRMLKAMEGITPSAKEFVEVIKDNPMILEVFDTPQKYFREEAVEEIAQAIRMLRNPQ